MYTGPGILLLSLLSLTSELVILFFNLHCLQENDLQSEINVLTGGNPELDNVGEQSNAAKDQSQV